MYSGTRRNVLAALATSPLAAACGGAAGTTARGSAEAPPAKVKAGSTLIFWNDLGGSYPAVMQAWADRFQQATGVKVEATGGIGDFNNKLAAAFVSGAAPDVYRYQYANIPIPTAVERGMLLKLDPYIKRDKYDLADFRKDSLELYRWKGDLLALPRDYGLQLIFYNTDVFQREGIPPIPTDWNDKTWTYAKFLEVCQRITKPGGERYALFVPRGDRLWESFIFSNGGAVVKKNADGLATEIALAEKPATDALQFMQDLMYKHKVAPLPSEEAGLGNQVALMQQGKLAMQITNPGGNASFKAIAGMPYDVGVFPLGAGSKRGVGGGGTGWAGSGQTKLQEEVWQFIASITTKQAQLDEVKIGQTTPSRISVGTGPEYLAAPPAHARVFADGQEYVIRPPMHAKWLDINREVVAKQMETELWTGKSSAAQVTKLIKDQADPMLR